MPSSRSSQGSKRGSSRANKVPLPISDDSSDSTLSSDGGRNDYPKADRFRDYDRDEVDALSMSEESTEQEQRDSGKHHRKSKAHQLLFDQDAAEDDLEKGRAGRKKSSKRDKKSTTGRKVYVMHSGGKGNKNGLLIGGAIVGALVLGGIAYYAMSGSSASADTGDTSASKATSPAVADQDADNAAAVPVSNPKSPSDNPAAASPSNSGSSGSSGASSDTSPSSSPSSSPSASPSSSSPSSSSPSSSASPPANADYVKRYVDAIITAAAK